MLTIGAASKVINPQVGSFTQGGLHETRAKRIRDDLEANALLFRRAAESVLLISCDLACLEADVIVAAREAIAARTSIPPRNVIVTCTHTHEGPVCCFTNPHLPRDEAYLGRLRGWLVEVAEQAVAAARPARVGWALGSAHVGYNRRACWADGTHTMHGDATRPDFTGLEGPDDPRHFVLFAEDADGKLLGVLHGNSAHATVLYGLDGFSADYPGAARGLLRQALGPVPVLYLNGGIGDQAERSMLAAGGLKPDRTRRLQEKASLLAGETLRLMGQADLHEHAVLRHRFEDLRLPVRLPSAEAADSARRALEGPRCGDLKPMERMFAHGLRLLYERYKDNPWDTVPVHAIRIGDAAIVTNPCELYCQFSLDIKRRSPARHTAVADLADGYCGYCPTTSAALTGGYSSDLFCWCRLGFEAGYRIVETAAKLLHALWKD